MHLELFVMYSGSLLFFHQSTTIGAEGEEHTGDSQEPLNLI